ncbi:MAG: DUF4199 domain-containing protein [Bacteroidota bacterium]|nr:DUF4199 domain-containing protein [Bacteroidota bacterium]
MNWTAGMNPRLKYGLMAGFWMGAIYAGFIANRWYNSETGAYLVPIIWAFLVVFILLGIWNERKLNAGSLELGEGFKAGLGITVVAGLVFSVFVYFIMRNYGDIYIEYMSAVFKEQMFKKDFTQEDIVIRLKGFADMNAPYPRALQELMMTIAIGTVFSLVFALILKRKPVS